jgi:hypothetical protein
MNAVRLDTKPSMYSVPDERLSGVTSPSRTVSTRNRDVFVVIRDRGRPSTYRTSPPRLAAVQATSIARVRFPIETQPLVLRP